MRACPACASDTRSLARPPAAGYFSLNVPSGLTLYWFANNLITTAQQARAGGGWRGARVWGVAWAAAARGTGTRARAGVRRPGALAARAPGVRMQASLSLPAPRLLARPAPPAATPGTTAAHLSSLPSPAAPQQIYLRNKFGAGQLAGAGAGAAGPASTAVIDVEPVEEEPSGEHPWLLPANPGCCDRA